MSASRSALVLLTLITLAATDAWALGGTVAPEGAAVQLTASRSVLVKRIDTFQLITQIRYNAVPAEFAWLIAVPNVIEPLDNGVILSGFPQAALDELDELTQPVLLGECGGNPTTDQERVAFTGAAFTSNVDPLPMRIFAVNEIEEGQLTAYLTDTLGYTISANAQAFIDGMVDRNFMFVVAHVDTAALGVQKLEPVVSITWPDDTSSDQPIALLPTAHSAGERFDLVMWSLADTRARASLQTDELDLSLVEFSRPGVSNYDQALDEFVAPRQTQRVVTEFADGAPGNAVDPALAELVSDSNAVWLTRLRARFSAPAMRNNGVIALRNAEVQQPYDRNHGVAGFPCRSMGGPADAAVGDDASAPEDGGLPEPADGGPVIADSGVPRLDSDVANDSGSADGGGGGGGGGGCLLAAASIPGQAGGAALFLVLLGGLHLRRRW